MPEPTHLRNRSSEKPPQVNVLITTRYFNTASIQSLLATLDPRIAVKACYYVDNREVRLAREERPKDPDVARRITPLTDEQMRQFADADIILGYDLPANLPEVAPRLRWFHLSSSGFGHCSHSGLPHDRITITHSRGANSSGVAEFVIARIFEHAKRLPTLAAMQQRKEWKLTFGRMVAGRTLAIVGMGNIGIEVARRAVSLGLIVTGVGRPDGQARIDTTTGVSVSPDLVGTIRDADIVVLCAADSKANHNMFNESVIAAMKPGALFINVARGVLVDETALRKAVESGHLAAAALDVTVTEPIPQDDPLWSTPNIRLSYHSATAADTPEDRKVDILRENLERFLSGRPLLHQLKEFNSPASSTGQP